MMKTLIVLILISGFNSHGDTTVRGETALPELSVEAEGSSCAMTSSTTGYDCSASSGCLSSDNAAEVLKDSSKKTE